MAIVRMLWHSEPFRLGCIHHLVANVRKLGRDEVWTLLRFVGFDPCEYLEFIHYETLDEEWRFGDREGTRSTCKESWDADESEDEGDEQEG